MRVIPFLSLTVGLAFAAIAWRQRARFADRPYHHWFIWLHLACVGLHQFEEYGWPGDFRAFFVSVFAHMPNIERVVPSVTVLEIVNVAGFTTIFGLVGWRGTRVVWLGLGLLFANFGNGFFHLIYGVTRGAYVPGMITGALLYLPLGLFATRFAVLRGDVSARGLAVAFAGGTVVSFAPFIHIYMMTLVG